MSFGGGIAPHRRIAKSVGVIALSLGAAGLTGCAAPQAAASAAVPLTGTLSGDDWEAQGTAIVTSDVANSEYYVDVPVAYAGDRSDNRTPTLSASVTTPTETIRCETSRAYIWSSMEPGAVTTLTLWCDGVIIPNEVDDIRWVSLQD